MNNRRRDHIAQISYELRPCLKSSHHGGHTEHNEGDPQNTRSEMSNIFQPPSLKGPALVALAAATIGTGCGLVKEPPYPVDPALPTTIATILDGAKREKLELPNGGHIMLSTPFKFKGVIKFETYDVEFDRSDGTGVRFGVHKDGGVTFFGNKVGESIGGWKREPQSQYEFWGLSNTEAASIFISEVLPFLDKRRVVEVGPREYRVLDQKLGDAVEIRLFQANTDFNPNEGTLVTLTRVSTDTIRFSERYGSRAMLLQPNSTVTIDYSFKIDRLGRITESHGTENIWEGARRISNFYIRTNIWKAKDYPQYPIPRRFL